MKALINAAKKHQTEVNASYHMTYDANKLAIIRKPNNVIPLSDEKRRV